MSKKLSAALSEIAESTDFPPTLSTAEICDKPFTLTDVRVVTTVNGERYIGYITLDGESHEAWLSGSKLHQQVSAVVTAGLPCNVKITKADDAYAPYLLELAD